MLVFGTVRLVDGVIGWFEPGAPGSSTPYVKPPPVPGEAAGTREGALRRAYEELYPALDAARIQVLNQDRLQAESGLDRASTRFYRVRSLLQSATLVLLALPVYLYHWRRAQRGV